MEIVETKKTDQTLVANFLSGDETAFEILYKRYKERIYTLVLYQTDDSAVAADLFQDISIKFYKNLDKFQHGENLKAWLTTMAINSIRDYWRKKNRFKKLFRYKNEFTTDQDDVFIEEEFASDVDIEKEFIDKEFSELLGKTIRKLSEPQREVIHLHYIMDMTFREIASILDCSINTVSSRARYALIKIKRDLITQI
ncbi:MAG: sigma-70 family RNA polymerase sigma factor [Bacteroidales bacterium]|nr:sigma-70 family RNA polymerase sigma factor [Bacteroidales bacterium]